MHMIIFFLLILLSPNFASEPGGPVDWTASAMHAEAGAGGTPPPSSPVEAAHLGGTVAVPAVAAGPTAPHPDDAELTPGVPTHRYPANVITPNFHLYMRPGKVATAHRVDPGAAETIVVGTPDDQLRIRQLSVIVPEYLGVHMLAKPAPFESWWEAERRRSEGIADPTRYLVVFCITNDGAKLELDLDKSAGSRTDYLVDCRACTVPPEIIVYTQNRSWPGNFPSERWALVGVFPSLEMKVSLLNPMRKVVNPDKGIIALRRVPPA